MHIYLLKKNLFSSLEPYSVIPVYSTPEQQQRVPRNTNETEESVEKIDEAVSRLSHLMLTGLYQPEVEFNKCEIFVCLAKILKATFKCLTLWISVPS